MALVDTTWYCNAGDQSTTGHYAVAKRPQNAAVAAGQLVRQFTAPTVGNERVFVCIVAGTTANVTDATWVLTRGAKTTDGTATWQECTGQASLNGDLTNTQTWAAVKAATPAVLGQIIKRSNNASYQICTTAGAMSASEPAFSDTAGVTTTDTTAVWTSLGVVGNFTGGQAPFARLASACAANWFATGNTIYIGNNHAESQSTTLTLSGTGSALPSISKIICHNRLGSYPPASGDLTTGATITTIGNIALNLSSSNSTYFYGIAFVAGSGAVTGGMLQIGPSAAGITHGWFYLDNCTFRIGGTGTSAYINIGGTISTVIFNNTVVGFGDSGQALTFGPSRFIWQNTGQVLVAGSAVPNPFMELVTGTSNIRNDVVLEALDLSQLTGVIVSGATGYWLGTVLIKDCKLNSAATITSSNAPDMTVQLVRSSS